MEAVKRIEIVTLSIQAEPIGRRLERIGVTDYTIFPEVHGAGGRGRRMGDELTGVSGNCVVLVACPAERLDAVVAIFRPILRDFGGVCLVSDALSIKH